MSELIDLVNSDGEIVKRAVERDDVNKYGGLYMQIIIAVISNSIDDILVHKRAKTKKVNGGDLDHVCGVVQTGETFIDAALREAIEEVGVEPKNLELVRQGINPYGRYCFLLSGKSDEIPSSELDPLEVEWASYFSVDELRDRKTNGEFTFVDGFFEDIEATK